MIRYFSRTIILISLAVFVSIGISNAQTQPNNPRPNIVTISPTSAAAGSQSIDLTITGTGFLPESVIKFDGSAITTVYYVGGTKLTAVIPASKLTTKGNYTVSVTNPPYPGGGGGGESYRYKFAVGQPDYPKPTIQSISPPSVINGDPDFILTIKGTNFTPDSYVYFGDANIEPSGLIYRPTPPDFFADLYFATYYSGYKGKRIYVSPTELQVKIPSGVFTNFNRKGDATFLTRVGNPVPGGGLTEAFSFIVFGKDNITPSIPLPSIPPPSIPPPSPSGHGYLRIVKETYNDSNNLQKPNGADGTFNFHILPTSLLISVTTTNSKGESGIITLDVNNYDIAEDNFGPGHGAPLSMNCVIQEYSATNNQVGVSGVSGATNVPILEGLTTVCTQKNNYSTQVPSSKGTLVIVNNPLGEPGGSSVRVDVSGPTPFSGYVKAGSRLVTQVDPGSYSIVENLLYSDWFDSASCDKSFTFVESSRTTGHPQLDDVLVEPGQTTTCTFNNRFTGYKETVLEIIKETYDGNVTPGIDQPNGPDGTFYFSIHQGVVYDPFTANFSITTKDSIGSSAVMTIPTSSYYYIFEDTTKLPPQSAVPTVKFQCAKKNPDGTYSSWSQMVTQQHQPFLITDFVIPRQHNVCKFINHYNASSTPTPAPTPTPTPAPTPPSPQKGTLRLIVTTRNNQPGTFDFDISGPTSTKASVSVFATFYGSNSGSGSTNLSLDPGTYTISEILPAGWRSVDPPPYCLSPSGFIQRPTPENPTTITDVLVLRGDSVDCFFRNALLVINTESLLSGKVGIAYYDKISAEGGKGSYSWKITSGFLPPGLSLVEPQCSVAPCQAPATIIGQPTEAGTYTFTVRVIDTENNNTAEKEFTIVIDRSSPDLSFKVTTDKSRYDIGEDVVITVSATNNSSSSITLSFPSSYQSDYVIDDDKYRWSNDKTFAQALTSVTLQSGETKKWNFTHKPSDYKLKEGKHKVNGEVVGYGNASTDFDVGQGAPPGATAILQIVQNTPCGGGKIDYIISPTPSISTISVPNADLPSCIDTASISLDPNIVYSVFENTPAGWAINSITCDQPFTAGPIGITNLTLVAGKTTTCTFTNTKKGNLEIIKNAIDGNGIFDYNITGPTSSKISIKTSVVGNTGSSGDIELDAGKYSIEETITGEGFVGWTLESVVCYLNGDVTKTSNKPTNRSYIVKDIPVVAGERTTCVFTNIENLVYLAVVPKPDATGNLRIIKNAIDGNDIFKYQTSYHIGGPSGPDELIKWETITNENTGSSFIRALSPGKYSITENLPHDWIFKSITCYFEGKITNTLTNSTNNSSSEVTIKDVPIVGDRTTTCTFTNTKKAAPLITPPQDSCFQVLVCGTDGETYSNTCQPKLAGAEMAYVGRCKADPTKGTLRVVKNAIGGGGIGVFDYDFYDPSTIYDQRINDFSITTDSQGKGSIIRRNVKPGNYVLNEYLKSDWRFHSANCYVGKNEFNKTGKPAPRGLYDIEIRAGNTTTCIYNNFSSKLIK